MKHPPFPASAFPEDFHVSLETILYLWNIKSDLILHLKVKITVSPQHNRAKLQKKGNNICPVQLRMKMQYCAKGIIHVMF